MNNIEQILVNIFDVKLEIQKNQTLIFYPEQEIILKIELKSNNTSKEWKKFKILTENEEDKVFQEIFSKLNINYEILKQLPGYNDYEIIQEKEKNSFYFKNKKKKQVQGINLDLIGNYEDGKYKYEMKMKIKNDMKLEYHLFIEYYLNEKQYQEYSFEKKNSKLFLCGNSIPIKIIEPIHIKSCSKFMNFKNLIEIQIESHENVLIKNSSIYTLNMDIKENYDILKYKKKLKSLNIETQNTMKNPFQFIYQLNYPILLEKSEKYSIIIDIQKNDNLSFNFNSNFIQFTSLFILNYEIQNISFSKNHYFQWNYLQDKGLIIDISCPNYVIVNDIFKVSFTIKNFTDSSKDFISSFKENNSLFCLDKESHLGIIESNHIKKFDFSFISLKKGHFQLLEIHLFDKISNLSFQSISSPYFYSDNTLNHALLKEEEEIDFLPDPVIQLDEIQVLDGTELLLARDNETYQESFQKKSPSLPKLHTMSISNDPKFIEKESKPLPIKIEKRKSVDHAIERRKSVENEVDLDSPTFTGEGEDLFE